MDDELEIPRQKRTRAVQAAEPAPPAPTAAPTGAGKRVRFMQPKHLNGDAFYDSLDPKPRDMKPGDVAMLKAHRADELERKGVVIPA